MHQNGKVMGAYIRLILEIISCHLTYDKCISKNIYKLLWPGQQLYATLY